MFADREIHAFVICMLIVLQKPSMQESIFFYYCKLYKIIKKGKIQDRSASKKKNIAEILIYRIDVKSF